MGIQLFDIHEADVLVQCTCMKGYPVLTVFIYVAT